LSKHAGGRRVHYLPPYRPEHTLKLQQWFGWAPQKIETSQSVALIKAIVNQRSIKTSKEIEYIEEAVKVTGEMHLEAMRATKPGMKECEVMSRVHQKALEQNCNIAFPIILTVNGQTLHNHSYDNTIKEDDVILCDAGAEKPMGY